MNSIAYQSPIVREMILRILTRGDIENTRDMHRIDNDIVPKLSDKTHTISKNNFQESILKINKPIKEQANMVHQKAAYSNQQTQHEVLGEYGRIIPLIRDLSISSIEYTGEGEAIKITKQGRILNTNIILSGEEVKSILNYISQKTRIPIQSGVIKIAVDNLLFTAVIYNEMGIRFLIKKNFQISENYQEAFQNGYK